MLRIPSRPRATRRSTVLTGAATLSVLFSLLIPTSASAVETVPRTADPGDGNSLTAEALAAVSEQQITEANSGTEKFSAGDLVDRVRSKIEADRVARDKRIAEEAARAKAAEEARIAAEEAARVEAERVAAEAKAAEEAAKKSSSSSAVPTLPPYTGGGSKDEWLRAAGIAESDWVYVDYIVNRESGWNPNAVNSSSGASGLVQALPCGKVPGSCFDPVDNLKWADGYAKGRYGSWAQAYDFWVTNHWW